VAFHVAGVFATVDPSASDYGREWEREPRAQQDGFGPTSPRVVIRSSHVWPGKGPSMYQRFDVQRGAWDIRDELPFVPETEHERREYEVHDGNGFLWLNEDCQCDGDGENWRWSRSDAFEQANLGGGRSDPGIGKSRAAMFREKIRRKQGLLVNT